MLDAKSCNAMHSGPIGPAIEMHWRREESVTPSPGSSPDQSPRLAGEPLVHH